MYLTNSWHLLDSVVNFNHLNVSWGRLHENSHAVTEDWDCGDHHQNGEQECADRVSDLPIWSIVDDHSRNNDTYALHHVADHVDYGSPHIDVLFIITFITLSGPMLSFNISLVYHFNVEFIIHRLNCVLKRFLDFLATFEVFLVFLFNLLNHH